jgi:hypothetical protein
MDMEWAEWMVDHWGKILIVLIAIFIICELTIFISENHFENLLLSQGYNQADLETYKNFTGLRYDAIYNSTLIQNDLTQFIKTGNITNNMVNFKDESDAEEDRQTAIMGAAIVSGAIAAMR